MDRGWYELSLDVSDFEASSAFYGKLGFEVVSRSAEHRCATVQRGNCRLGLYQGRSPEPTLLFWCDDPVAITRDLKAKGLTFEREPGLLRDPDGLAVYFVNIEGPRSGPALKGDRRLGWFVTNFAVTDLARSVAFYETLGFARRPDGIDPDHIAMMGKDDCSIGLYQGIIEPDTLQLTFWQGDVEAVSAEFAAQGLGFVRRATRDDTGVGSVLKDPDGHIVHLISVNRLVREESRA